jgi:hypothetical protein
MLKEVPVLARALLVFSKLGIAATSETSYDAQLGPAHSSRQAVRRATFPRFFQQEGHVWGFLIGLYIALIIWPYLQEWHQHRTNKARLAKMRKHHAAGHRWDVRKGQWIDN